MYIIILDYFHDVQFAIIVHRKIIFCLSSLVKFSLKNFFVLLLSISHFQIIVAILNNENHA